jgi:hypothetical protein
MDDKVLIFISSKKRNYGKATNYFTRAELQALSLSKREAKGGISQSRGRDGRSSEGLRSVSRPGEEKEIGSSENNSSDSDSPLAHENQRVYKTQEVKTIPYSFFFDLDNGSGTTDL